MKFIHTADWHLGKLVHGVYMTEDQREILNQFIHLVEEEQPDAVVIAGDLYDRSVPPTSAVDLLDEILYKINVELKTPVVAIGGNHDSAERLSFGSSWYKQSKLYLTSKLTDDLRPVHINGVNFYSIPYAEPGTVRQLLADDSIHSHHDAMKALVGKIEETMNHHEANVLVGHAFVLGGQTSDSERTLSVGGSGCVNAELFEPFSYTALGHLHSPDAIKHEKVKYSGSLLKYSFSEATQRKAVSIIEMNENGDFELRSRSLTPKQDMRELEGHLEELLDPHFYQKQCCDDYLKITLLDEGALIDPINKLRQVYPNVLHLERKAALTDMKKKRSFTSVKEEKKSELDLFAQFYNEMTTSEFSTDKREIMVSVIEKVLKEEGRK
ncbi:exonuclease sbcCD subunit D [Bacillus canaveralius]|uniref:Nuclease SbcCD subunit D n=1 Tax=Bacillus canaveralius TaxID=1403243 RepID=A0A2N5GGI1_9BACI|nr:MULTISPECIES: exonuclease SbcCD subunit D [Bacillus]PLR79856.1 exonuclease sbcCD subunit D [Bacillus canaveralius]PLR87174.1 exonuclease sbcCD subunit D [Bacillus sp. V33-4]PLR97795.1 exonuclease sbcCD subunit D [Bacillus canaveralius]RSK45566.1 exonuclease SbcCD subunit D [Bacillus canaveralius]